MPVSAPEGLPNPKHGKLANFEAMRSLSLSRSLAGRLHGHKSAMALFGVLARRWAN